jgi:hypothetical protein
VVAQEQGLQLIAREIRSPRDAVAALESIQDSIDA